jgi:hypothetical protein
MFLLRLLTTGVCVACVVMLAAREPPRRGLTIDPGPCLLSGPQRPEGSPCEEAGARAARRPPVSVLDVAHGVAPDALAALVHLRPTEWVSAINDRALDPDLPVGYLLAMLAPHAGQFVDLTVSGPTTERRVLVLLH